jgi:hypothetical protein
VKTSILNVGLVLLLGSSQWIHAQAPPVAEPEAKVQAPDPVIPNPEEEAPRPVPDLTAKTNTSPIQVTNRPAPSFSRATNINSTAPALRGFITNAAARRTPNATPLTQSQSQALRGPNPNAAQIPGNPGAVPPSPAQTPPGLPLPLPSARTYSSTNVTISGEEVNLNFLPNTPLEAVFDTYSRLTGRTVLRPNTLPGLVTIKTLTPLTREEAIEALNSVFALNGIVMISVGKSFVKAVPPTIAPGEGTPFSVEAIQEGDHYVTQIIKIKNALAADVAKAIAPLSKTPNQVVAIEASQTIILRDLASVVKRMMEVIEKIDVAQEQDYKLEVIPIKYGKVTELYDTMNSLVSGQASGGVAVPRGGEGVRPCEEIYLSPVFRGHGGVLKPGGLLREVHGQPDRALRRYRG